MFQRLKGAIDSRIAEEQARQRALQNDSPSRSSSVTSRSGRRDDSPAVKSRAGKLAPVPNGGDPPRNPDPKEFEPEIMIEDEDAPSRALSPQRPRDDAGTTEEGARDSRSDANAEAGAPQGEADVQAGESPVVLPSDVRVKLRKLERLESRYQELLRSYRIAHSRVSLIEPFEASLREHTPLTSISDPGALVEYLSQVELKSNMSHQELKRVSQERDTLRAKLANAEKKAREEWDQTKAPPPDAGAASAEEKKLGEEANVRDSMDSERPQSVKSPLLSGISKTSFSIFSPKKQSPEQSVATTKPETMLLFDSEMPRLEGELEERQKEVVALRSQVDGLKHDLATAQESTQSMAENLESTTRDLNALRERSQHLETELANQKTSSRAETGDLRDQLERADAKSRADEASLSRTQAKHAEAMATVTQLQESIHGLELKLVEVEKKSQGVEDLESAKTEAEGLSKDLQDAQAQKVGLVDQLKSARETIHELQSKFTSKDISECTLANGVSATGPKDGDPSAPNASNLIEASTNKKKNKKKKKVIKASAAETKAPTPDGETSLVEKAPAGKQTSDLHARVEELETLLAEKEALIERLQAKLKGEDDLREEIESLKEQILFHGEDLVETKDNLKKLKIEKTTLEGQLADSIREAADLKASQASADGDSKQAHEDLTSQFEELQAKAADLQTDLTVAKQLASSRFKDLTDMRALLQKAQPEMAALRQEVSSLSALRDELKGEVSELRKVEVRYTSLRSETGGLRRRMENEKLQFSQSLEQSLNELKQSKEEISQLKTQMRKTDESLSSLEQQNRSLKDDLELKTAQHASAEGLMESLRNQTTELVTQQREAQERCESLEEEVAEAHRLLSERSREAETIRRLLSDAETRADTRIRDMKERMDSAIEERDRAEDEASTVGRRRARELEDIRSKLRDAERTVKRAEDEKDELERAQKDWKKRREELEHQAEASTKEAEELRKAMSALRDALDDSERQARGLEKQKAELRRTVEDTQQRLERLQKSNKALADEARAIQAKAKAADSQTMSSRSSLDVDALRSRAMSPAPKAAGTPGGTEASAGPKSASTDYLKNVLLQFLEQKDKKHQMQLVPVLGMLLHFDKSEEQRMAAILAR